MTTRLLLVLCAGFVGSAVSAQAPDKKAKQKEENAALLKEVGGTPPELNPEES